MCSTKSCQTRVFLDCTGMSHRTVLTNFAGKFGWSTVETLCVPNFFTKTNILYQSSQRTVLRHWKYYQLQMYWLWVLQSTHKSWLTVHFTKFLSISCILITNPYIACECFIISFLLASDHVYWMKCKSLHLKEYYVVAVLTLVGICNAAVSVLQKIWKNDSVKDLNHRLADSITWIEVVVIPYTKADCLLWRCWILYS